MSVDLARIHYQVGVVRGVTSALTLAREALEKGTPMADLVVTLEALYAVEDGVSWNIDMLGKTIDRGQ